ncbi:MAG TPA: helix-turn-helix transcriptional regulator [Solirubrobacteraceae bacterium]|jgi:transcriptional regulator with XRE-family HTH domain|nr:helix-turn-helix transcriptional regulator [Solirubrobacteraceae bacterium]
MQSTGDREIDGQLEQFGQNIRRAREKIGLSQDRLGLDRAAVSFLERAERSPDLPTVVRVAHAVEVTPAALLKGIGVSNSGVRGPRHQADPSASPASRFGINLRWARQRAGISQEALALKAEVDRAAISVFEHGRRDPNLRTILKLARALEVPPAMMLGGVESSKEPLKSSARQLAARRASPPPARRGGKRGHRR